MRYKAYISIGVILTLLACSSSNESEIELNERTISLEASDSVSFEDTLTLEDGIEPIIGELESYLIQAGLVDVQTIVPDILVELKYSTADNFMGFDMYGDLNRCYLQPDVASKLIDAQAYLKEKDSTLTLLIYDGVRPRSVQQMMWDTLDMPIMEKVKFVSNPAKGSLHNFGAAVDITIAKVVDGTPIDMGAPYDHIGIEAYPMKEKQMLEAGRISKEAVDNRKLLRRSMRAGGFFNIQTEWWHFNSCYRKEAIELYEMVEGLSDKEAIELIAASY